MRGYWSGRGEEVSNAMATILLVDDDLNNREPLSQILTARGHRVVCAGNGKEALAALPKEPIDLVLLDLMMPDMDGVAFLGEVRKVPRGAKVPVVVLSAISDPDFVEQVRGFGADDYLIKSRFTIPELLERIGLHLEGRKATG